MLERTLEIAPSHIAEGQAISEALKLDAASGETLRPGYANSPPRPLGEGLGVRAIVHVFPREQRLDKALIGSRTQETVMTRVMELLRATGVNLALVTRPNRRAPGFADGVPSTK